MLGWPVAHSRSPAMHRAAYEALGLKDHRYDLLPVPPELFTETVLGLGAAGLRGANVTIPHKEAALALATDVDAATREIGAANTLTFLPDGGIEARNTDAPGLLAALPSSPRGAVALVLGAGGSARAAAHAMREAGAAEVLVLNRTAERARVLADDLGVRAISTPAPADLLINCTSVGLRAEAVKDLPIPAEWVRRYATVVDLVYREGGTALIELAREQGATVVDGLEILVRQGALSLERWTGREAPLEAMRRGARAQTPTPHEP